MTPTFIILFREIMEISIILSIILAATRGISGRNLWVMIGIGGGLLGSAVVAIFAGTISDAVEGMGQEIFNAGILLAAVLMIGWTVIWMQTHGREMSQKIKNIGQKVHDGKLPLYALATVVSLSMWREGAEIVLFMTGILSTTKESMFAITAGGLAGSALAASIGLMLYFGLVKFSTRYLFATTSWLLVLLACGMSAQAAGYLVAADKLPELIPQLWDSSWLLSESSLIGRIFGAMLGYTERPSGIQLAFYLATFILIAGLLKLTQRKKAMIKKNLQTSVAIIVLATAAATSSINNEAHALVVQSPYVEEGIMEIEFKNRFDFDDRKSEDNFRQHKLEVSYGVNSWWSVKLEGEWEKDPGDGYHYEATELYNIFQLTEVGEYWMDAGLMAKYIFKHPDGKADKVKIEALLAKQYTKFTHMANIGFEQEVGRYDHNRNPKLNASWMSLYHYNDKLSPGFEYYGNYDEFRDMPSYEDQKHRFGPVLHGKLIGGIKYDAGVLFGISKATEDYAVKLNFEYEFPVSF